MTAPVTAARTQLQALAASAGAEQYLTFNLGGEAFAIGILCIKEIIEYGKPTTVPMMPAFIHGVINLRGAVLPVIDLSARFARGTSRIGRRSCIVILEVDEDGVQQDIGVIVDSVNEVVEIPPSDIEPPPAFGAQVRTDYIRGMGRLAERFVILLDVARVFSMQEMSVLQHFGNPGLAA
ncbi:MAG: chemotaxis protein CheW [Chitinivorax sp.]